MSIENQESYEDSDKKGQILEKKSTPEEGLQKSESELNEAKDNLARQQENLNEPIVTEAQNEALKGVEEEAQELIDELENEESYKNGELVKTVQDKIDNYGSEAYVLKMFEKVLEYIFKIFQGGDGKVEEEQKSEKSDQDSQVKVNDKKKPQEEVAVDKSAEKIDYRNLRNIDDDKKVVEPLKPEIEKKGGDKIVITIDGKKVEGDLGKLGGLFFNLNQLDKEVIGILKDYPINIDGKIFYYPYNADEYEKNGQMVLNSKEESLNYFISNNIEKSGLFSNEEMQVVVGKINELKGRNISGYEFKMIGRLGKILDLINKNVTTPDRLKGALEYFGDITEYYQGINNDIFDKSKILQLAQEGDVEACKGIVKNGVLDSIKKL